MKPRTYPSQPLDIYYNDKKHTPEEETLLERQREEAERQEWLRKLYKIDPAAAFKVQGCGTYGTIKVITNLSGQHRLIGGSCDSWLCPKCGPRKAHQSAEQLSAVVRHLTAEHGIQPDRFVFGAVTMSKRHGSLQDRMELLSDTLSAAMRQRWFQRAVLGYEAMQDYSDTGSIHGHWHVFFVLAPDADLETLKHRLHDYFRAKIGNDMVQWDSSSRAWEGWLAPAMLTPTLYHYMHGHVWKHSSEVTACNLKPGKRGEGYSTLYDRSFNDLVQIVPCMRRWDSVRRGRLIADARRHLKFGDQVRTTIRDHQAEEIPSALWRQITPEVRSAFRDLVACPSTPAGLISDLVFMAQSGKLSPESWGALVLESYADPIGPWGEYSEPTAPQLGQATQGVQAPAMLTSSGTKPSQVIGVSQVQNLKPASDHAPHSLTRAFLGSSGSPGGLPRVLGLPGAHGGMIPKQLRAKLRTQHSRHHQPTRSKRLHRDSSYSRHDAPNPAHQVRTTSLHSSHRSSPVHAGDRHEDRQGFPLIHGHPGLGLLGFRFRHPPILPGGGQLGHQVRSWGAGMGTSLPEGF